MDDLLHPAFHFRPGVCRAARLFFLCCALAVSRAGGATNPTPAAAPAPRPVLTVVCDDNYPPYVFREADGRLRGIVPDLWALWEQKTGVHVDLQAMDWSEAQRQMREGHADVIDTIFLTPERTKLYDFTPAYAAIDVPVYVQKSLGGIADVASLKGFTIGVKAGDSAVDYLQQRGIDNLKLYPSYEAIILAAQAREIRVFSVDEPAAVYFLCKHGIADDFRRSFVLYRGAFHRAVPRNRPDLMRLVCDGFTRITPAESHAIHSRWLGYASFPIWELLRAWRPWILGVLATVLALVLGNVLLGSRVRARTLALRMALADQQRSLEARRQSEEELRISGQYLASVLNAMNDALFVNNPRTGAVLDVNRRTCEMFGFASREAALGTSLESICSPVAPYDVESARVWIRRAVEQGPQNFEWQARHQDGHLFWVDVNMRQDRIGPHNRLIVTVRDTTARKRVEECREIARRVLAILNEPGPFERAMLRMVETIRSQAGLDAVGVRLQDGEEFPYYAQVGFSAAFLQTENALVRRDPVLGVERNPSGCACLDCTCGLVLAGGVDAMSPLVTRGGSFWTGSAAALAELPSAHAPHVGSRRTCIHEGYASLALIPVRSGDRIIGLLHLADKRQDRFTLDTVEQFEGLAAQIGAARMRRRAEEVLRESESKYRAIITASPVPMALNDEQQHITFLNPAFVQTFGYTLEDIPSLDLWWPKAFPDASERARVLENWQSTCAQSFPPESPVTPFEATVCCKDGSRRTVLIRAASLPGPFARTNVIVAFDITAYKQAEEQLQNVLKLQSVGTLAGGLAHDFNNILQALFGNLSLARDDLPENHPSLFFLDEAEKSLGRATSLTRQLLTFAKGGDPVMEDVSLGTLAEEVARFDLTGSPVSLVVSQADDLWPVQADRGQIQQVISNLVINARQAMPTGGHLFLALENVDLPGGAVDGLAAGRYVRVTVRDEGTGIDPQILPRIFDPYFTTKPNGSGLGLTTVYSILTKHGGTIRADSEPGKGATFTLHLPAARTMPGTADHARQEASNGPVAGARILVMDDELPVRQFVTRILTRDGHAVETAAHGQEAVDLYTQARLDSKPFDLVILDLTVPGGMGGKDTVQHILAADPKARTIVSSGYSEDPVMASPTHFGFAAALAKPFTQEALRKVVSQLLNGAPGAGQEPA